MTKKEGGGVRTLKKLAATGGDFANTVTQLGDIAVASQAVVSHRVGMALEAFSDPNFNEHAEFATMTTEKFEAMADVAGNLLGGFWNMGEVMARTTFRQGFGLARAAFEVGMAPNPAAAFAAQQRWAVDSLTQAGAHAVRMTEVLGNVTAAAVEPIHSRATANAKRLSKRS